MSFAKSTIQRYKNCKVDVGVTNLQCPWNSRSLPCKDWRMDIGVKTWSVLEICKVYHTKIQTFKGECWHYKLTVSVIFAQSTMQRYNNWRVKVEQKHTTNFKGGHWRYKLTVSLKFATSTVQRYNNSKVDVGVTNLQCPWNLQSLPYKDTKTPGWMLALQTCSVQKYLQSLPYKNQN